MTAKKTRIDRETYELAQCRAEDWLIAQGEFSREAVKEIMLMLAQKPRENEYRGLERRAV
jgi:hypothetical protein